MENSGIKININSSDKLFFDESEKIQKVIKFAVKQAVKRNRAETNRKISNEPSEKSSKK